MWPLKGAATPDVKGCLWGRQRVKAGLREKGINSENSFNAVNIIRVNLQEYKKFKASAEQEIWI